MIPNDLVWLFDLEGGGLSVVLHAPGKHEAALHLLDHDGDLVLLIAWLDPLDVGTLLEWGHLESNILLIRCLEALAEVKVVDSSSGPQEQLLSIY